MDLNIYIYVHMYMYIYLSLWIATKSFKSEPMFAWPMYLRGYIDLLFDAVKKYTKKQL